ncbi:ATP-grasp domain-containing protein [Pantoea sp. At-9b]|uniref:ATP-grasp domain-containing protein n=1 Tax=Pantoea sp. (strain At-9b) TaxID=592316 RepID=UPI0001B407BD|nr:ATP-grasp domain-containing protein [Pantoea sp. At-9b]ADU72825.1 protein of unknown function DUF201 [Pantoea sp. At-9b]
MLNKSKVVRPVIVIVDAVSSGALLTEEMAPDFDLVHVESDASVHALSHPRFHKHLFKTLYRWEDRQEKTLLHEIARHSPLAIIPGNESAVMLADKLAWHIEPDGNNPDTTSLRRDKYLMNEAVGRAGLKVTPQTFSHDPEVLKKWFRQLGKPKVVVKPLDSAGSDDVYICTNEKQIETAVLAITGKQNSMHNHNHNALIQQFIDGTEYVVNTVSLNGIHKVTDVWRVSKRLTDGRNLYDYDDLCNPVDAEVHQCIAYTLRVLDATGIVKGAGHTELILTSEGPVLLEVAARASGAANPKAIRHATGSDQLELMKYAYTCPETFHQVVALYHLELPLRCVHAIASKAEPFSHAALLAFLEKLPGFVSVIMKAADGGLLRPTTDVSSCPAAFFLTGQTDQEIALTYFQYRQWEAEHL